MSASSNARAYWSSFAVAVAAGWGVASFAWMQSWYWYAQIVVLLVTVALASVLLFRMQKRVFSFFMVLAGLIVGNWSVLQSAVTVGMWSVQGFAP